MTDQPMSNRTYRQTHITRSIRPPSSTAEPAAAAQSQDEKRSLWATMDKPLLLITGLLLTIGAGMVFSTTFDWSLQEYGSNTAIFLRQHMRNVVLSTGALVFFAAIDYRFWKRFAPLLLLVTLASLIAVLIFGDDTFGARRSLIGGRFQPGELAEFAIVVYMAAWLGARNTRIQSIAFGLVPFGVLVGIVAGLVALQPDLSSAAITSLTAVGMYYLAGARVWHLGLAILSALLVGALAVNTLDYAQNRWEPYVASLSNPIEANYHTQQAIIAFVNGGWFGVGLGQGEQKFGFLPAPHTDSIFAVIGEELGVVGASFVVLLFVAFVVRGLQIARRAVDPFGALLAVGFTMWVAVQALLNIAVMTAVIPSSGLPLPFISYGGSALLVLMIGVGLMLSVSRIATIRQSTSNGRKRGATYDRGWGNRRARLSRAGRRRSTLQPRRHA
jgi:cell division protein FtsW